MPRRAWHGEVATSREGGLHTHCTFAVVSPPDSTVTVTVTGLFSEDGDVIPFHIVGSLTIPTAGIKRV